MFGCYHTFVLNNLRYVQVIFDVLEVQGAFEKLREMKSSSFYSLEFTLVYFILLYFKYKTKYITGKICCFHTISKSNHFHGFRFLPNQVLSFLGGYVNVYAHLWTNSSLGMLANLHHGLFLGRLLIVNIGYFKKLQICINILTIWYFFYFSLLFMYTLNMKQYFF